MKIKCKEVLKTLQGQPIKDGKEELTLGMTVANILLQPRQDKKFSTLKAFSLAQKFFNENEVDLDDADLKTLKELLETDTFFSPLVTGQILKILG